MSYARLTLVAAWMATSAACGWFAASQQATTVFTDTDTDPAAAGPACRPASLDARGAFPYAVGDTTPSGWQVTAIDSDNMEYVRFELTRGADVTQVEIAYNSTEPDDWATDKYRLMPAPEAEPPQDLLKEIMDHLRTFSAAASGAPFVRRTEGVDDPYEGLPPCEE
ncbi:MAG: hypothetical protein H6733_15340 [Alphaproteobacteria bacterium]|nr:hypothetical protein [Alphaproteobacteria bacterium]